jgi:hypothetical protein
MSTPREKSTWTVEHRWLASRRFDEANTELAYIDALAAVDGLIARRDARQSGSAMSPRTPSCGRPWRGCARFAALTR